MALCTTSSKPACTHNPAMDTAFDTNLETPSKLALALDTLSCDPALYAPHSPDPPYPGPQVRAYSVTATPTELQKTVQRHQQRKQYRHTGQDLPWWQYYYQLYHYHPPPGRKPTVFGSYLLLQTLGEGEFGKVKLGIHMETGQEVAIKLMKKDNIDSSTRMTKVEREISVLRTVRHPYIVKLYDVIETEKYIGIIQQCASGGELFDYILAHRYLKEKDAKRLFAQLISGVHYMHQKHIIHRDLKLENLLLDRHRSIVITDFGFANQFNSARDDLMSTSCGSPCYAAPELVISEGLYVGSAVDIWSCGVILFAMLCGYLPFDDDPGNPEGDNINRLYKYILNTTLTFPDYVGDDARDLLQKMLVPDPSLRCTMKTIIDHPWLTSHRPLLEKSVQELEAEAISSTELRIPRPPTDHEPSTPPPIEENIHADQTPSPVTDSDSTACPDDTTHDDEKLTDATPTHPEKSSITMSHVSHESLPKDTAIVPAEPDDVSSTEPSVSESTLIKGTMAATDDAAVPDISCLELPASAHPDSCEEPTDQKPSLPESSEEQPHNAVPHPEITPRRPVSVQPTSDHHKSHPREKLLQFLAGTPGPISPQPTGTARLNASVRPMSMGTQGLPTGTGSILQAKFISSMQRRVSMARQHDNSKGEKPARTVSLSTPFSLRPTNSTTQPTVSTSQVRPIPGMSQPVRGTRRKALSLLVGSMSDYISSDNKQPKKAATNITQRTTSRRRAQSVQQTQEPQGLQHCRTNQRDTNSMVGWNNVHAMPSVSEQPVTRSRRSSDKDKHRSTGKKLMDWFKKRPLSTRDRTLNHSAHGDTLTPGRPLSSLPPVRANAKGKLLGIYAVDYNDSKLRIHQGAVEQEALTSRSPQDVIADLKQTLNTMGIDIKRKGEFRLKCVRRKRATMEKHDSFHRIPLHSEKLKKIGNGVPFRMLLRRSTHSTTASSANSTMEATIYGDPVVDPGEEVRFSVELCKIKNLPGLYIVDIRRLHGDIWAYKFLYHTLLDTLNLNGKAGRYMQNLPPSTVQRSPTSSNHRISSTSSGNSSALEEVDP
ncbi:uncharacterized protein BYT42DRAFT_569866 [Radiomyces spectabilis]|uniref:uncharacterized protein n=1 Tax=Radiomyces spectabilis TaxID=64574 RepID=UPI002220E11C|nr:uncharacterized protein BYT42DRAFT_569866 [Radiomyces spectabilis]KAI8379739.1 hypothetical protein BYT42DRAFT_569866 [Radiomyces spectabilis]